MTQCYKLHRKRKESINSRSKPYRDSFLVDISDTAMKESGEYFSPPTFSYISLEVWYQLTGHGA